MRKNAILILMMMFVLKGLSQAPGVISTTYIKNSLREEMVIYDSKPGIDSGFIVVGADTGFIVNNDLALTKNYPGRPWIAKLNDNGNKVWSNDVDIPGNGNFTSVCVTPNQTYMAIGYAFNLSDVLAIEYTASGTMVWSNTYGGWGIDRANSVQPTADGGFIIAGFTTSNDTAIVDNHGEADVWIIKISSRGSLQWRKCYGGLLSDTAYAIVPASDGGFIVAGASSSFDGDLTGNNGGSDGWVFKINDAGNIVWQKNIGGPNHEAFKSIVVNSDNTYTLTGHTSSASVLSNGLKGRSDVWVVKIDGSNGNTIWSKGYGGSRVDQGFAIQRTIGNGFLVVGHTESGDGDITKNLGAKDALLMNLDNQGTLVWQKTFGTNRSDFGTNVIQLSANDFVVTGFGGPSGVNGDSTDGHFTRLGNASYIKGNITSSRPINFGIVKAVKPGKEYSTTPVNGSYFLPVDTGTYTVSFETQNPLYTPSASKIVTILVYDDTATANFNVTSAPDHVVLRTVALALEPARPGFGTKYQLTYANDGTDPLTNGEFVFIKDRRLNFVSSMPSPSTVTGDTLKWTVSNLQPLELLHILVQLTVAAPPAVDNNSTLRSTAIFKALDNPDIKADTAVLVHRTQGAVDPNDKADNLGGIISKRQVDNGDRINYIIRFQNTGNDTAFNVFVRDTLDSKLDWPSLQMIAASHSYKMIISNKNQVEWRFPDIKLVDSIANEPLSHGYIIYRVRPKTNLVVGDIVRNSASIYFDFNLPVKTNVQETVVNNITLPQPTITSFTPISAATGASVTITGTNFNDATAISFGGTAATSFTVNSATSITAVVGAGASGDVSVTTPGGTATRSGFTFIAAPTITSFTPTSGAAGTSVTITGTNFTGATAVSFGGTSATSFTVNSATSITAVVATGASGNVSVTTPGGTATRSGFTFIAAPTITSFTPTSGAISATITITGTNFTGATAVSFGGTAATSFTVNSATSITAVVGAGASGNVSVTTPGGTATRSGFTFIAAPTITSFTPTSGATGTSVTITGTNLTGATAASFGGAAATSFTVNSATSITAIIGAGASGDVSVTTPGGTVTLGGFTFIAAPIITSFTPISGAAGASVTIMGTNFTGATAVSFGGTAATSFIVNSATSITAIAGTGASGDVSVTTPGGTTTLGGFTFIAAPTITSFTPTSGATGTSVTITGTNLTGATAVNFGGTVATSFTVNSATSITAVVGAGASGNVSVTTPGGTVTFGGFTFIAAPNITSFTPTSGAAGASVTITGTNFTGATAVSFGGTAATSFAVNSATSITAVVGTGTSGNISVTTPGGIATLSGFEFVSTPVNPVGSGVVRFYPNPTPDAFTIDTLRLADNWESLDIFDISGRIALKNVSLRNQTKVTINIRHLKNGLYMALLRRRNAEPLLIKFLKQ